MFFSSEDARKRQTQISIAHALAFAGQVFPLPLDLESSSVSALALVANSLLNIEHTFYAPDDDFRQYLARTGAKPAEISSADYIFYLTPPVQTSPELTAVAASKPNHHVTIVLGCRLNPPEGTKLKVRLADATALLHVDLTLQPILKLRETLTNHNRVKLSILLIDTRLIVGIPSNASLSID